MLPCNLPGPSDDIHIEIQSSIFLFFYFFTCTIAIVSDLFSKLDSHDKFSSLSTSPSDVTSIPIQRLVRLLKEVTSNFLFRINIYHDLVPPEDIG